MGSATPGKKEKECLSAAHPKTEEYALHKGEALLLGNPASAEKNRIVDLTARRVGCNGLVWL